MLRRLLLDLSAASWARNLVTGRGFARRAARRFVAGETLDDALAVVRDLSARRLLVTLDYLGESVTLAEDTVEVVKTYREMVRRLHEANLGGGISLKLTHMGLDIDEVLCRSNLRAILTDAQAMSIPVAIDMESSAYVEKTLAIYRSMRDDEGFSILGTVIQAYLRRSQADMAALAAEGAHIRIVKGAYLEPADIAFPLKADVDASYVALMKAYLSASPPAYLCIATHDEQIIQAAEDFVAAQSIGRERFEFQMLYGIRTSRQETLAQAGYTVRVYVPFGEAWYPYFMRRLAERPANVWFFARSFFRR